jgi:hypothetical protein
MIKCFNGVGALNLEEVGDIIRSSQPNTICEIVVLKFAVKFPGKFFWKDDPKAVEFVQRTVCEPYPLLVLFFRQED